MKCNFCGQEYEFSLGHRCLVMQEESKQPMPQPHLVSKLRERIADYLKGGGLFNPEMAEHDRVRELLIDCHVALMGLESQPSPSTPIVSGTAGLSAEQVQRIVELHHNDGIFLWASMAADLNALLGTAKPVGISIDALEDLMQQFKQREARIRKDVLEEAAQHFDRHENGCPVLVNGMLCTCKDRWPWIGEAIRALAERPAPAGEVKGEK